VQCALAHSGSRPNNKYAELSGSEIVIRSAYWYVIHIACGTQIKTGRLKMRRKVEEREKYGILEGNRE
jgi:hypothetical protein